MNVRELIPWGRSNGNPAPVPYREDERSPEQG